MLALVPGAAAGKCISIYTYLYVFIYVYTQQNPPLFSQLTTLGDKKNNNNGEKGSTAQ